MDLENKIAQQKLNEIKKEIKSDMNIAKLKIREYEDFLNLRTSLSNIDKMNYLQKLQDDVSTK